MRYVLSDLHGEYQLFECLLKKINFSPDDVLYVCGDVIEKGAQSVLLAQRLRQMSNAKVILGNHEYSFIKYYDAFMSEAKERNDVALKYLQDYFTDNEKIDWETIDWIRSLDRFIQDDDFICVHAGVPMVGDQMQALETVEIERLLYDRKFKDKDFLPNLPKCVFFGHTPTYYVHSSGKILAYKRKESAKKSIKDCTIKDFCKVHLDLGSWHTKMVGCFCIDTLKVYYATQE